MSCRAEALDIIQEAVEILQQLAAETVLQHSIRIWHRHFIISVAVYVVEAGRQHEALGTIQQALTIRRKLATERPAAFNTDLAYSLHQLAFILSGMGREEEALDAIQRAVEIRRGLAMQYPLAFKVELTRSLDLLSRVLFSLGKDGEATVAREEADSLASS
jgi:tetratricopeptide (TPR) repeat protein